MRRGLPGGVKCRVVVEARYAGHKLSMETKHYEVLFGIVHEVEAGLEEVLGALEGHADVTELREALLGGGAVRVVLGEEGAEVMRRLGGEPPPPGPYAYVVRVFCPSDQ